MKTADYRELLIGCGSVLCSSIFRALALLAPLLSFPAAAQQLPESFDLKLSQQGVMLVEKGLMELPYKDSAPWLADITRQVQEQSRAGQPAAPTPMPPAAPEPPK